MDSKNHCRKIRMCSGIFFASSIDAEVEKAMDSLELLDGDDITHFLVHLSQNIHAFFEAILNNKDPDSTEKSAYEFLRKMRERC